MREPQAAEAAGRQKKVLTENLAACAEAAHEQRDYPPAAYV